MKTWDTFFIQERKQQYFQDLMKFLDKEYEEQIIYPSRDNLFTCFTLCPLSDVKVVILGQDPYHQPNQAHGLSFSVQKGVAIPRSLKNIYKELKNDIGVEPPTHGCLTDWAKQGVFLMNAVMSVREGKPASHANKGWEIFTDHVIEALNKQENGIVFVLWGNYAQKKAALIDQTKHRILQSAHPSPLSASRGFFGSCPFSKVNNYLAELGRKPIDWKIQE